MKKIISWVLVVASVLGCTAVLASCNSKKKETDGDKISLEYSSDALIDMNDTAVINASGLSANTDTVKTASKSGEWDLGKSKKLELQLPSGDLSSYRELSIWMNNTSSSDIYAVYMLESDNNSTSGTDYYYAIIYIHPGWHQYNIPMSELKENGTPLGFSSVQRVVIDCSQTPISGSPKILVDSVYGKTQKYGTTKFFSDTYKKISKAVCFFEDGYYYVYDQLRYAYEEGDRFVTCKADSNTAYVPVSVLAEHRGATDIKSSKEKVTFKYNGKDYEFTPKTKLDIVGDPQGFVPGKAMTVTPMVVGDYIMLPMEYCKELFGYELFYDQMGLVIFSDTKNIYDSNRDYNALVTLIETIIFDNYTGAELVGNMNAMYGEDGHKKLILNEDDIAYLKNLIKTDPIYASWFSRFEASYGKGSTNYNNPMKFKFELADGYRMLSAARAVMNYVIPYAFLYRMTDDVDYAKKVIGVMKEVSKFQDNDPESATGQRSWHPEHYLDNGETDFGFSIGYDWCYDAMTDAERAVFEDAVWEMGYGSALGFSKVCEWWAPANRAANLEALNAKRELDNKGPYIGYTLGNNLAPYNEGYFEGTKVFNFDRANWTNNWNAVCNGGIGVMALAFANVNEAFREKSEHLLDCIMYSIPFSLKESYAPDGGYPEGPGYWGYGTSYSIYLFSSLLSATGTDVGFINYPGFRESFYFINSMGTLQVGTWNYHDAGVGSNSNEWSFWFAVNSGDDNMAKVRYNAINTDYASPSLWDLMFYRTESVADSNAIDLALDAVYYGIDTCTFRSDWTTSSLFCGLHGGANAASHGQLDIGNFILEIDGVRFFRDLGADEYNLTGDFGNKNLNPDTVKYFSNPYRYWYYRMRAEGHNTLVINPSKVDVYYLKSGDAQGRNYDSLYSAVSKIQRYESGESSACAIIDMGCAYLDASSGRRGMLITDDRTTVIIQDEMTLTSNTNTVYWFGHIGDGCKVTVSEDKKSAIIEKDGKRLLCEIVVPDGYTGDFKFQVMAADYLQETGLSTIPGEYSRSGYQKLAALATNIGRDLKVAVVCRMLSDGPSGYTWTPMDSWVIE